nr:unnamed protein product [Callosobruchus analis]
MVTLLRHFQCDKEENGAFHNIPKVSVIKNMLGCFTGHPQKLEATSFARPLWGTRFNKRIVGGEIAALGQFPWMARLGYKHKRDRELNLTVEGALINRNTVVTAAIALVARNKRTENHQARRKQCRETVDCEGNVCAPEPQDFKPKQIIPHADFGSRSYKNDIGLLIRLKRDAVFHGNDTDILLLFPLYIKDIK